MEKPVTTDELSTLLEHSHDIIVVIDDEGTTAYVSPSVERVLGYDPDELLGGDAFELIHPDDRGSVVDRFAEMVETAGRTTERIRHRMKRKDGGWVWMESIGSNRTDSKLGGYVINSRDISERREREQMLTEYREFMEAVLDSLEDGVFVIDTDANIRRWNSALTEISGYTDEEVASMSAVDFIQPAHRDRVTENLEQTLETGSSRYEADLVTKEGDRIPFEFISTLLEDPDGDVVIAGVGRDVTERKERVRQLQVLDRVLRHNFNNDMTIIRGYAETIRDEVDDDSVAMDAEQILKKSQKLTRTVRKEREIVGIVTERPDLERTDVTAVCQRMADMLSEVYPESDIAVDTPASPVISETEKLARAVEELVENAIRHNDRPKPSVTISVEKHAGTARITVADNGPEIPDKEIGVLLGKQDIEPLYHGSGLGLWLVHWIVSRSNGTLKFEANEPRGNRVIIELPAEPDGDESAAEPDREAAQ